METGLERLQDARFLKIGEIFQNEGEDRE